MLSQIRLNISKKLKDRDYRIRFFEGRAQDDIAYQLREARRKRNLTQPELGKLSGMKQSAISRIEQSSYSRWSFRTLLRIARALDLRVRVVFDYAEDVIGEYEMMEGTACSSVGYTNNALNSHDYMATRALEAFGVSDVITNEARLQ